MSKQPENEAWEAKDGAVNSDIFKSQNIKILWVLREPHGRDFDFLNFLANPCIHSRWKNTYGLVVKVSQSIFADAIHDNYPTDIPKIMSKIAVINLNKRGGGSKVNHSKVSQYFNLNIEFFKNQISELDPDLIILAGTRRYLSNDLIGEILNLANNNTKVIEAYHPNQRSITHHQYINAILSKITE